MVSPVVLKVNRGKGKRIVSKSPRAGSQTRVIMKQASLPIQETVIFVVSTTGQGEAPNSMKGFWRKLLQRNLGGNWLGHVQYAVFGLGDSGYQKYNFVAKKLNKRLVDLGATPIVEKGLGDDQHPLGY